MRAGARHPRAASCSLLGVCGALPLSLALPVPLALPQPVPPALPCPAGGEPGPRPGAAAGGAGSSLSGHCGKARCGPASPERGGRDGGGLAGLGRLPASRRTMVSERGRGSGAGPGRAGQEQPPVPRRGRRAPRRARCQGAERGRAERGCPSAPPESRSQPGSSKVCTCLGEMKVLFFSGLFSDPRDELGSRRELFVDNQENKARYREVYKVFL